MLARVVCLVLAVASLVAAAVPTPKEHFGFVPGDEKKLANYQQIVSYFEKLAQSSDRIRLQRFGTTALGKPMVAAFLSSPENLKALDRYRDLNRRLALGEPSPEEARKLAAEGKAIVWIDSGLHSTETAPAQHSPELAYKMLTDEGDEVRRIRQNVILIQIPVINPDGLDMVVDWYTKNLGTPHEMAALPVLYQKYAGHDNNRDWFMLNLPETRHVTKLLFQDWFPHIVYNQHQSPAFPARIFVPPYAEPLNPNIPAPVMEGIHLIGAAMKERFAREDKPGVLSYYGFDGWWNGGLRSVPAFHNMHGILTETALVGYGAGKTYQAADLPERFPNGMPTKEPSIFYQRPWLGGYWGTRPAIEYMLTADMAILDLAASRPSYWLQKAYDLARKNIDAGQKQTPYAYVVPQDQFDRSVAPEMLRRLQMAGVQVQRAKAAFSIGTKSYPAGTWVLLAGQPFRPYLVDLMEPQNYPDIRTGPNGPPKRPYDVAGWTLPMSMGVQVDRATDRFQADLESVANVAVYQPTLERREVLSYKRVAGMLAKNEPVRWKKDGNITTLADPPGYGYDDAVLELRRPKVALYEPHTTNMDAGWTQWALDEFQVPYTLVRNSDMQQGNLRQRFDTIILASQSTNSLLHGSRAGERPTGRQSELTALQRPEYTGGIGVQGLAALEQFVRSGGTLIAFDAATDLPASLFPLPLRSLVRPSTGEGDAPSSGTGFYSPGSLLRVTVDDTHPIGAGMPKEAIVFSSGGQAWDTTLLPEYNKGDQEVKTIVRYAEKNLLASGYVSGERAVLGKAALVEARHGQGRVVLFGFRPQFRGQTYGSFKLLLNAIYLGSAKPVGTAATSAAAAAP